MPNGADKNLWRLRYCIAAYRLRFREWPNQARFQPEVLWDIANILDLDSFARLADLLELRTQSEGISVGGVGGVQHYADVEFDRLPEEARTEATRWLSVEPRDDLRHM